MSLFQKANSMVMRMDGKEGESEVVGQSSMEELDYEASDNLEEESVEQQSENDTSNGNGVNEESVGKAANDETENEVAVNGDGDNSVEVRASSKESQTDSKSGDDTGARNKSSE